MKKYKCSICGREYDNLEDYMNCVKECGEAEVSRLKEEQKKRKEINAALNKVKSAKSYYEDCLKDFKLNYPDAYELNFGKTEKSKSASADNFNTYTAKEAPKNFSKTVEVEAKKEKGKDPDVKMKVDGKDIDYNKMHKEIDEDGFIDFVMGMLGL